MMNKIQIILVILLGFIFLAWGNTIVPKRIEIGEIETVRVLGLDNNSEKNTSLEESEFKDESDRQEGSNNSEETGDSKNNNSSDSEDKKGIKYDSSEIRNIFDEDDVMMTIIRENEGQGDNSQGEQSANKKQEVVTVIASNFAKAVKALQNYKSKSFTGGHIKYVIMGEQMAENNFVDAIDFVSREVELRLTAQMYIARELTANEVISGEGNSAENMADVLENLDRNINSFGISENKEVLDVIELVVDRKKCGLIPTLMTASENKYNKEWEIGSSKKDEAESTIEFAGYGIIKDAKLIDYLSLEESRGANFVNNTLESTVVTIKREEEKDISLDLITSVTKVKFLFDGDELKKIAVKNQSRSNITQIVTEDNQLTENVIKDLETEQAKIIKNEIDMVIKKSQQLGADFLNIEERLRVKHPYKYEKLKDNWSEIYQNIPIEVTVETRVRRLYDVLELESES